MKAKDADKRKAYQTHHYVELINKKLTFVSTIPLSRTFQRALIRIEELLQKRLFQDLSCFLTPGKEHSLAPQIGAKPKIKEKK